MNRTINSLFEKGTVRGTVARGILLGISALVMFVVDALFNSGEIALTCTDVTTGLLKALFMLTIPTFLLFFYLMLIDWACALVTLPFGRCGNAVEGNVASLIRPFVENGTLPRALLFDVTPRWSLVAPIISPVISRCGESLQDGFSLGHRFLSRADFSFVVHTVRWAVDSIAMPCLAVSSRLAAAAYETVAHASVLSFGTIVPTFTYATRRVNSQMMLAVIIAITAATYRTTNSPRVFENSPARLHQAVGRSSKNPISIVAPQLTIERTDDRLDP